MKQIMMKSARFAGLRAVLESQCPSYEMDVSIQMEIQNLDVSQQPKGRLHV